jgi:hypothetical protein
MNFVYPADVTWNSKHTVYTALVQKINGKRL